MSHRTIKKKCHLVHAGVYWLDKGVRMKRVVDIYRKNQPDRVLWTYIVSLGGDGTHPSLEDFKEEALTLAAIDGRGSLDELDAYVHLEIVK